MYIHMNVSWPFMGLFIHIYMSVYVYTYMIRSV